MYEWGDDPDHRPLEASRDCGPSSATVWNIKQIDKQVPQAPMRVAKAWTVVPSCSLHQK